MAKQSRIPIPERPYVFTTPIDPPIFDVGWACEARRRCWPCGTSRRRPTMAASSSLRRKRSSAATRWAPSRNRVVRAARGKLRSRDQGPPLGRAHGSGPDRKASAGLSRGLQARRRLRPQSRHARLPQLPGRARRGCRPRRAVDRSTGRRPRPCPFWKEVTKCKASGRPSGVRTWSTLSSSIR